MSDDNNFIASDLYDKMLTRTSTMLEKNMALAGALFIDPRFNYLGSTFFSKDMEMPIKVPKYYSLSHNYLSISLVFSEF
jgi:hypothetical protein